MCLVIVAYRVVPDRPLVVAANRDEFHARETAPAAFWPEHPDLLAGRDLEAGGTWMGITRGGRFAAVTNFRDPANSRPAPRSRGELTLDFLTGQQPATDYLAEVAARGDQYAGFNLLLGDDAGLWYLDNAPGGTPRPLEPGVHGLSNARLNTPWPKSEHGKARLQALLNAGEPDHDRLATVVADRALADADSLRLQGLEGEMERMLSAQFIISPGYGTRSTTTLWSDGLQAHWREQSFDPAGSLAGSRIEVFGLR